MMCCFTATESRFRSTSLKEEINSVNDASRSDTTEDKESFARAESASSCLLQEENIKPAQAKRKYFFMECILSDRIIYLILLEAQRWKRKVRRLLHNFSNDLHDSHIEANAGAASDSALRNDSESPVFLSARRSMNYATQKLNGMSGCRVTVFPGR
jgi:hypothetical protein